MVTGSTLDRRQDVAFCVHKLSEDNLLTLSSGTLLLVVDGVIRIGVNGWRIDIGPGNGVVVSSSAVAKPVYGDARVIMLEGCLARQRVLQRGFMIRCGDYVVYDVVESTSHKVPEDSLIIALSPTLLEDNGPAILLRQGDIYQCNTSCRLLTTSGQIRAIIVAKTPSNYES